MGSNRLVAAWRRGGLALSAGVLADRLYDVVDDLRAGTQTGGLVPIETLIADWQGSHDYYPTAARTFRKLMSFVAPDPNRDSFVDIGSGKGRVVFLAARYPFRRIYGYEISRDLIREARVNLDRCRRHLSCQDIEFVPGDAGRHDFPTDATVFYLYNPCHGEQLERIVEAIRASVLHRPRPITVLFNNTRHFAAMEARYPWLHPVARLELEHSCAVYRATDG